MDGVVEKLGFFDFINLIIVGMFTIVGCFGITYQFGWSITNDVFKYLKDTSDVNTLFLVLCVFALITISYIIGLSCLEVFNVVDKNNRAYHDSIANLFNTKSCVSNQIKRNRHVYLAKMVFDNNGIAYPKTKDGPSSLEWDYELNNYFFTYCVYQVQIREMNSKTERLRDIEGLARAFCASCIFLSGALLSVGVISRNAFPLSVYVYWTEVILLIVIYILLNEYRKKALENRIKMTLDLFDAIYVKEIIDSKTKKGNQEKV